MVNKILYLIPILFTSTVFAQQGSDEFVFERTPNANDPSKISLPSSDTSMVGAGLDFQKNLNRGEFITTYPIPTPSWFQIPFNLSLIYSSQQQAFGPLSNHWSINLPTIQIHARKGVPLYNRPVLENEGLYSTFDQELVVTDGEQGELRPLVDSSFRRYKYHTNSKSFTMASTDGLIYIFGNTEASRISQDDNHIYSWFISEIKTPSHQRIEFEYDKRHHYPLITHIRFKIHYNIELYRVTFEYEDRDDDQRSYRYGFLTTIDKRVTRISLYHIKNGQESEKVHQRTITLNYTASPLDATSVLSSIQQTGFDEEGHPQSLPRTSFVSDWQLHDSPELLQTNVEMPDPRSNRFPLAIDWNGDGVSDLISQISDQRLRVYLQSAKDGFTSSFKIEDVRDPINSRHVKLGDVDGDRKVDLIVSPRAHGRYPNGYYRTIQGNTWSEPIPFTQLPLTSPRQFWRHMLGDLNRDGKIDFLYHGRVDGLNIYIQQEPGTFEETHITPFNDQYPRIFSLFHRKYIQLADINGDGLSDIGAFKFLSSTRVSICYSEGTGYGFNPEQTCLAVPTEELDSPTWDSLRRQAKKKWFLMDITGDGKADFVAFSNNRLVIYYQTHNGFQRGQVTSFYRSLIQPGDRSETFFWDANGNGSTDLVIARKGSRDGTYTYHTIDFNPSRSIGNLIEVNHGQGLIQRMTYTASSLACESDSCHPNLPDVFPVLSQKQTYHWNEHINTEQLHYEQGFYDHERNQFQGFGNVSLKYRDSVQDLTEQFTFNNGSQHFANAGALLASVQFETIQEQPNRLNQITNQYQIDPLTNRFVKWLKDKTISYFYGDEQDTRRVSFSLQLYEDTHTPQSFQIHKHASDPQNDRMQEISYHKPTDVLWFIQPHLISRNGTPHKKFTWHTTLGKLNTIETWSQSIPENYVGALLRAEQKCQYISNNPPVVQSEWVPTHRYLYNSENGLLTHFEDHAGKKISLQYDDQPYGFLPIVITQEANGLPTETNHLSYDWHHSGKIASVIDPRAHTLKFEYDSLSRLHKTYERDDPNTPQSTYTYMYSQDPENPFSRITVHELENPYPSHALFDASSRKRAEVHQTAPNRYRFLNAVTFDGKDKALKSYLPFSQDTLSDWTQNEALPHQTSQHDGLGRLKKHTLSNEGTYHYQLAPKMVTTINPRNATSKKEANDFDEPVRWRFFDQNRQVYQANVTRNKLGQIVELNAGNYPSFNYRYHPQETLWRVSSPVFGAYELYETNLLRHKLKIRTNTNDELAGFLLSSFDAFGRNTQNTKVGCLGGQDQINAHTLTYGQIPQGDQANLGLLISETFQTPSFPNITRTYQYDNRDRNIQKSLSVGDHQYTHHKTYNAQDKLIGTELQNIHTNYSYQNGIDLSSISVNNQELSLNYSPEGLLSEERTGGFHTSYRYNNLTQWLTQKHVESEDETLFERGWSHDVIGNIQNISRNDSNQSFAYDSLDRVIKINDQDVGYTPSNDLQFDITHWFSWLPEAFGRLLGFLSLPQQADFQRRVRPFHVNTLGQIHQIHNTYPRYAFDFEGRLKEVTLNENESIVYAYTENHIPYIRMKKHGDRVVHTQTYIEEHGWVDLEANDITYAIPYGTGNHWVAHKNNQGNVHLKLAFTDHLGTPRTTHNIHSQETAQYTYDIYGQLNSTAPEGIRLGYAGQFEDSVAQVHFTNHRVYIPKLRRFASVDPLMLFDPEKLIDRPLEFNPYQYARNNPLSYKDTDGFISIFVHGTWSNPNTFSSDFQSRMVAKYDTGNQQIINFQWSGKNNNSARFVAANDLAKTLKEIRAVFPNEPINIFAHSHGGNISIKSINESGIDIDNLVLFGTPSMNDFRLSDKAIVKNFLNIYSLNDFIQRYGAYKNNFVLIFATKENPLGVFDIPQTQLKALNLEINVPFNGTKAHIMETYENFF